MNRKKKVIKVEIFTVTCSQSEPFFFFFFFFFWGGGGVGSDQTNEIRLSDTISANLLRILIKSNVNLIIS